jgi:acyl-CoA thioesterase FadM
MPLSNKVDIKIPSVPPHFVSSYSISIHDINTGQHLANNIFLALAEEAYQRYLRSLNFDFKGFFGISTIAVAAQVQYLSQGFYGEELSMHLWLTEHANSGFRVITQLRKTDREVGRIQMDYLFFDYDKQKVQPCPEDFIAYFNTLSQ